MGINVTGPGPLRTSATVRTFGKHSFPGDAGQWEGFASARLDADPDRSPVFLTDEDLDVTASVRAERGWSVTAVVQASAGSDKWTDVAAMTLLNPRRRIGERAELTARTRLPAGTTVARVKATVANPGSPSIHEGTQYSARVRRAPNVLTFIAMGGSGSGGSSGTGSGSSGSSSSGGSGSSSGHGIEVHPSTCQVDPSLIEELLEPSNVQCNNLCSDCLNFIERLGLRLLNTEGLANKLRALRHREHPAESGYCFPDRDNVAGLAHRVVLGKWENSEHEHFRPPPIKTFESILDEFYQAGGGTLIIVANSLAGAKLAATVTNHWRWDVRIRIALFVAWDATHLGGGIASVGSRPERVVNFFQTANVIQWWQNGHAIAEADREFDLTGCFSHNAIPRSTFVHDTTYGEIRSALAAIRDRARTP